MNQPSLQKISDIADILINVKHQKQKDIGLYTGNAGIALFLFYFSQYTHSLALHQKASEILEMIINQIQEMPEPPFSLYSGIAGVGWFVDHLSHQGFIGENQEEFLFGIDEYLYIKALSDLKHGSYDFIHGSMGVVLYFVKRNRKDYLRNLIQELANIAIWDEDRVKWRSLIMSEQRITGYNIALSHGITSIALVLCKIFQIMPNDEMVKNLIKGAVAYILHQEIPVEQFGSFFPAFSKESQPKLFKSRLAWCYGDLGVALAIWQAGITLQHQPWIDKGMEVLLFSTHRRVLFENRVRDAGICHGTAGIAQIFNRLFRITKQVEFKDAADYWCTETLNMAKFEHGLAGYKAWRSEEKGGYQLKDCLLEGIAGIGLCLLSFVMPDDPAWDECLLLS